MSMDKRRCIARGFGEKPYDRRVSSWNGRLAYLLNPDSTDPDGAIGFPWECVYEYDGKLLARLEEAHAAGRAEELATHWTRAVPLWITEGPE